MNFKMVLHILGHILSFEAILMAIPAIISLASGDDCFFSFLITIVILAVIGIPLMFLRTKNTKVYSQEGFIIVALGWILISAFGALPAFLSGNIPSYIDSLFEMISGFTTTGATILTNVEVLPKSLLFWRSFSHWIGGMGVLVFVMAILPQAEGRMVHLMRAEVPGPTFGKLAPRMHDTAKILYSIYFVLTLIQIIMLLLGGMPLFDSLCISFGTAGTGGFSITNNGIAAYNSYYLQGVITAFMILFGINFNLFYFLLLRRAAKVFKNSELRCYLIIIIVSAVAITINVFSYFNSVGEAFHHSLFQTASIMTTTGYSTVDFNLWPEFSKNILLVLMFIGGCAGSTAGGIKVSRLMLFFKMASRGIKRMLHPKSVNNVKLDGKIVDSDTLSGATAYLTTYLIIFFASFLVISLDGFDMSTTLSSLTTTINNVGPGLGLTGPSGSFSMFSGLSKIVFSLAMLIGRLEIFPVLLLFSPASWKRS